MRRTTWIRGRRGAVAGASAALVCLGGVLASCGSGDAGDGYVAVGAGNGSRGPTVAPTGDVTFVPLESAKPSEDRRSSGPSGSTGSSGVTGSPGSTGSSGSSGSSDAPDSSERQGDSEPEGSGTAEGPGTGSGQGLPDTSGNTGSDDADSGGTTPNPPPPTGGGTTAPAGPAELSVGKPERDPADKRWCEKVTVEFRNTGGTAVRSGTVTFGTHIIGPLDIDWATIESTEELPTPIAAGTTREETWTVCVDAWRVPLGMHVETRDVSVKWK